MGLNWVGKLHRCIIRINMDRMSIIISIKYQTKVELQLISVSIFHSLLARLLTPALNTCSTLTQVLTTSESGGSRRGAGPVGHTGGRGQPATPEEGCPWRAGAVAAVEAPRVTQSRSAKRTVCPSGAPTAPRSGSRWASCAETCWRDR